jgi:hypothetical protein
MIVPDWIGKLTSLVELVMYPGAESKSFVKELGKMTELRLLNTDIIVGDEEQARDLLESLSNLQKMETISILPMLSDNMLVGQPSLVLHHSLRKLEIGQLCFPKLPESINQQALPNLDRMKISLFQVEQHDMQIIGKFQNLRFLHLSVKMLQPRISISSGDGFQNLKIFYAVVNPPMFLKGAMPSLEIIALCIPLSSINIDLLDLDSGLGNLTSLQQSSVIIRCTDCCPGEVEEVEDMVRHAFAIHPNRPNHKIRRLREDKMVNDSGLLGPQRRRVRTYLLPCVSSCCILILCFLL